MKPPNLKKHYLRKRSESFLLKSSIGIKYLLTLPPDDGIYRFLGFHFDIGSLLGDTIGYRQNKARNHGSKPVYLL